MTFKPSPFQQAIFDWVEAGQGHAVVEAVAGSGKTTTAVQAIRRMVPTSKVLFLAFNKAIAEELQERVPRHCEARTLNSLGHRAWMRVCGGRLRLDGDKTRSLIQTKLSERDQRRFGPQVRRLVALAKSHGIVPELPIAGVDEDALASAKGLLPDTLEVWQDLIDNFDVDIGPCTDQPTGDQTWDEVTRDALVQLVDRVRKILGHSIEMRSTIDFDDQLYMPVIFGVRPPQYDWVLVDEAQDLSSIQHKLVASALAKGGRLMAIGDSRQAIYGFRGADSNSMSRLRAELGAISLPLSITYRCPLSHVRLAQAIVPTIVAAEGAAEGEIIQRGHNWQPADFHKDDLIICRANAPLVKVAFSLIARRVAVRILGRELGAGLITLVRRMKAANLDQLREKLDRWRDREIDKLLAKDPEANPDKVIDKHECIMVFLDTGRANTVDGLIAEIESLYSDTTRGVLTLCTVHKAKGLEADRVWILNQWMLGGRPNKKAWVQEQEENLRYVALTRAKKLLGFIEVAKRGAGPRASHEQPRTGPLLDTNGDPWVYVPTPGSEAERLIDEEMERKDGYE